MNTDTPTRFAEAIEEGRTPGEASRALRMNTATPLTDALPYTTSLQNLWEHAYQMEERLVACQRDRADLIALVQDAYDDPDSEILGAEWNEQARATLARVRS